MEARSLQEDIEEKDNHYQTQQNRIVNFADSIDLFGLLTPNSEL